MSTTFDPGTQRGIGHPNIILQKDYAGDAQWYAKVETMVPIPDQDVPKLEEWLESANTGGIDLANYLVKKVPDNDKRADARHMIAAALGFEMDRKTGKIHTEEPLSSSTAAKKKK
jgi:hypothetical protein